MLFEPAKGSHSLVEVIFFAQFTPPLQEGALKRATKGTKTLTDLLPNRQTFEALTLNLTEDGAGGFAEGLGGAQFTATDENDETLWLLKVDENELSIHCLDYTRWDEVWPKLRTLLLEALEAIGQGSAVSTIGFKNLDAYRMNGEREDYQLDQLLDPNSPHLTQSIVNNQDALWHCHTGWYGPWNEFGSRLGEIRVLNQINASSGLQPSPEGKRTEVVIEHTQIVRRPDSESIGISAKDVDWLDSLMNYLHEQNKVTLNQLLCPTMAKLIALNAELGSA